MPASRPTCGARRHGSPEIERSDSSARLPPSAFELCRVSSDVWCRVQDAASNQLLDARGAAGQERREISGVRSREAGWPARARRAAEAFRFQRGAVAPVNSPSG